ncbi:MAG: septum formation initiator family protein [Candidatus Nomurabacteria bacterium]|nr:septum formation initiator family protein [Candidatus Nomurabacteria bacterium]
MKNSQEQNIFQKIVHSKLGLIIFGIFVVFFGWSIIKFAGKYQDIVKNRKISEDKITQLQQEKDRLTKDINTLNTQSGVEATIREKYGLAKDGEGMIVITDNQDKKTDTNTQTDNSILSKIKGWFK